MSKAHFQVRDGLLKHSAQPVGYAEKKGTRPDHSLLLRCNQLASLALCGGASLPEPNPDTASPWRYNENMCSLLPKGADDNVRLSPSQHQHAAQPPANGIEQNRTSRHVSAPEKTWKMLKLQTSRSPVKHWISCPVSLFLRQEKKFTENLKPANRSTPIPASERGPAPVLESVEAPQEKHCDHLDQSSEIWTNLDKSGRFRTLFEPIPSPKRHFPTTQSKTPALKVSH